MGGPRWKMTNASPCRYHDESRPRRAIFKLVADPDRHPEFDGSGMLRPGASNRVIVGVGDVFVTKMFFTAVGDNEMHNRIVLYEADRRISWEPETPNSPGTGRGWRFDLTPDGPDATL